MLEALARLFSYIVQPCYDLTGSWWMAILLFTVIIKIVLMPLSLWCQWNSIVMVKIMPELNRIKVKYFGDAETIGEKQTLLNKKHHYHPLLSLIPLAAQILVLFGLVEVIHGITDHGAPGTEFLGMVPIEEHHQRAVHRVVPRPGRVRGRRHGLLLDMLEPDGHRCTGPVQPDHAASEVYRLCRTRCKSCGAGRAQRFHGA